MKEKQPALYMNGVALPFRVTGRKVLGLLFQSMPNLNLWSYEALKELYVESIKLVTESGYTIVNSRRLVFRLPKNREDFLVRIYNTILGSEGMSPLPGFGFSNQFGDKLKGNPEYRSIYYKED